MLKLFDVVCEKCKKEIPDFLFEGNEEMPKCECGGTLEKTFSGMTINYKLLYNPKKDTVGWANDGYATTQYYSEYKKAKERGEDVMPADELTGYKKGQRND